MFVLLFAIACGTPETKGDAVAGADVYGTYCVACHGADGTLGVETGGVPATDLSVAVPAASDEDLTSVIQNGEGTMPAQGLDDTQTADCIAYLREQWG